MNLPPESDPVCSSALAEPAQDNDPSILQRRFDALLAANRMAALRLSADGSRVAEMTCDFSPAKHERPTAEWLLDYVHPEDRDKLAAAIRQSVAMAASFRLEFRARSCNGRYRWLCAQSAPVTGDQGEILEWLVSATDVSERRQAEQALRRSEARYQSLFDSIDEGFCLVEVIFDQENTPVDYRFLEVNPAFERQTGLRNATGQLMRTLVPKHEQHWFDIYGDIAKTGKPRRFQSPARAMGDRWFDVYAFRIDEPATHRVAILFTDISQRKRYEQAKEEAARLASLRVRLTDGLRPLAEPDAIEAEAARILGDYLDADRVHYAHIVDGGKRAGVRSDYRKHGSPAEDYCRLDDYGARAMKEVRAGRTLVVNEVCSDSRFSRAERDATARLDVAAYVIVPLVRDGELISMLVVDQARPRAWSESEVHLIEETADRTWSAAERAEAYLALRESDRRKDVFLAMLAHELRNPLAVIGNTVHLLERSSSARSGRYLGLLRRQTDTLRGMVADLLDVSRITRGLVRLHKQPVDLAEVTRRALESVQIQMEQKRHEITTELPDYPVPVLGDPVRLEQIVVNLLTNAAKYTDGGGRIGFSLKHLDGAAELRVRDNGIGMTQDVLERIFDLFGQAERGLARAEGGLGIGLTIVKELVQLHNGSIEARSAGLGEGAEFVVRFPVRGAANAVDRVEEDPPDQVVVQCRRILIVEDRVEIAETMAELFKQSGHEVAMAHSGRAALGLAERFQPEIVFLDIGLPDMDGYDVAQRLRQGDHRRSLLLAALTGYGQPGDRARAKQAGFDAHFVKPVAFDELHRFVNRN